MKISELTDQIIATVDILNDSVELLSNSYAMLATDSSDKYITISDSPFLMRCRDAMWNLELLSLTNSTEARKIIIDLTNL